MKHKILLFLLFLLLGVNDMMGQSIWTHPLNGTNPNTGNPFTTGQTHNPNITVSGIGRGSGIAGTNANNRYNTNSWVAGTLTANKYFYFTLTPGDGYKINFTSLAFTHQRSSTGPNQYAIRTSLDNYTTNIASGTITGSGSATNPGVIDLSVLQNITEPIEVRLYAWGASAAAGTYSVNQFTFNGVVEAASTPCTTPAPVAEVQAFCGEATIGSLTATGTDLKWYATADATESLANDTALQTGTYYVSQTLDDCESERTAISVTVTEIPALPVITGADCAPTEGISAVGFGGIQVDASTAITTDSAGNVYTTGQFRETAAFGETTLTSAGAADIFVVKTDASGVVLWAKQFGGTADDSGFGITTDAAGDVYVTGSFWGTVVFDGITLVSAGTQDGFVVKINSEGTVVWAERFGGTGTDIAYGITSDPEGNIYTTGFFNGTATFGTTTLSTAGNNDVFVVKIDSEGAVLWANQFGGTTSEVGWGIVADMTGNVYVTGYFLGTVTFGTTTLDTAGDQDVFVVKIDSEGTALWANQFGGTGNDMVNYITTDVAGNVYVTGYFSGTATFGTSTLDTVGNNDVFVTKINSEGTVLWANQFGGTGTDEGYGITTDIAGNVYVTGLFSGTAAFESTSLVSSGNYDVFVVKADTSGTVLWAKKFGGAGFDVGRGLAIGTAGKIYMTGGFQETAVFGDTMLTSAGNNDIFVLNIGSPGLACMVTFCGEATVADLAAEGTNIKWYASSYATEELTNDTALVNGNTYYVSQTVSGCESERTAVEVTLNEIPEAPAAEAQTFSAFLGATVANLTASGEDLKWYATAGATEPLTNNTVLQTGTYFVSQTVNGCESERKAVEVTVNSTVTEILYVKKGENGDGGSWENALGEVADALKIAHNANNATPESVKQIWVAAGVYKPLYRAADLVGANPADKANSFVLVEGVKIYGSFAGTETSLEQRVLPDFEENTVYTSVLSGDFNDDDVISGAGTTLNITNNSENAYNVVISAGNTEATVLDGFTITGGYAKIDELPIVYVTVNGQQIIRSQGAGIHGAVTSAVFSNLYVTGNVIENSFNSGGTKGAGMYLDYNSSSSVSYSSFVKNKLVYFGNDSGGGAGLSSNGYTVIHDVFFVDNSASNKGGGLYYGSRVPASIFNIVAKGNKADNVGGGIAFENNDNLSVTNALIANNTADYHGGGISVTSSNLHFTNITVVNNNATDGSEILRGGGGMFVYQGFVPVIRNSIFYGNTTAGTPENIKTFLPIYNPLISYSLIGNSGGSGSGWNSTYITDEGNNIDTDPLFTNTAINDFTLQETSPALNAGNQAFFNAGATPDISAITTDLAGNARVMGENIEMGAYELSCPFVSAPVAEVQAFCGEATVADLTAQGTDLKWHAAADATESLANDTTLQTGTYYVSQTIDGCESERTAVEVTLTEVEAPVTEAQSFCGEATVGNLAATGTDLQWYATADTAESLANDTTLQTGTYYVSQTIDGCESTRTEVIVTLSEIPEEPEAEAQSFCGDATIAGLTAQGENLKWYATMDATEELTPDTALQTGTYYVSQTVNSCESEKVAVTIIVNEIPGAPVITGADCEETGGVSAVSFGGSGADGVSNIVTDSMDNVYLTGSFNGTAAFGDITLTSSGSTDAYITKTDASGTVLWAQKFGGSGGDTGSGVTTDSEGNVYIIGQFIGTVAFGDTVLASTSAAQVDIFVVKINASGTILWAQKFGGTSVKTVSDITADSADNIYITGQFSGTTVFGGISLTSTGNSDAFAVKADSSGNILWAKRFGGTNLDGGMGITTDFEGNVYVTGQFGGTGNFDGITILSAGGVDGFIVKIDSSGTTIWAQRFGGTGTDGGRDVFTDATGNVYVTGNFANTASFGDMTLISAGNTDAFIAKMDASGTILWIENLGGSGNDTGAHIITDTSGNIYVSGSFTGSVVFGDTTLTSSGLVNGFLIQINPSTGSIVWAQAFKTNNAPVRVAKGVLNTIYVSGIFNGTFDFEDVTLTSEGNNDVFLLKLGGAGQSCTVTLCGGTVTDLSVMAEGTNIKVYASADSTELLGGDTVLVNGNTYYLSQTIDGCESTRTEVEVTVNEIPDTPVAEAQEFCGDEPIIADLNVTLDDNATVNWYATADATETLTGTTALQTGIYYVSQTIDGCESTRTEVEVTVNEIPDTPVAEAQEFCGEPIIADLNVTLDDNATVNWYATADATEALTGTAALQTGIYYVSQTIEGCESERTAVSVTVNELPDAPVVTGTECEETGETILQWAKNFGGIGGDLSNDVTTDAAGNVYTTGRFAGTATFGDITLTGGGNDIFVIKTSASGNVLWAKGFGGATDDIGNGIATDAAGNVYITGRFSTTATFEDITLTTTGGNDIFVAKLDTSGNVLWAKAFGGTGADISNSIATDTAGNVYITGQMSAQGAAFGSITLTSAGGNDIFVSKLDASGNVLWAQAFGGTGSDAGNDITTDTAGNVYITGLIPAQGATFGSITLASAGTNDIFVSKLDASGNVLWAKNFGGTSTDEGRAIATDVNGYIYVTGYSSGTATFGDISLVATGTSPDVFAIKIDTTGTVLWAKGFGGTGSDLSHGIAPDTAGNVYITGQFNGTATFEDITLTSAGGNDVFVSKLDASSGGMLWAKAFGFGGTASDIGLGIATDTANNMYITGQINGTVTFEDITLTSAGNIDGFLLKFGIPEPTCTLTLCGSTIADLPAEGNDIKWYDTADSTEPLAGDTALVSGNTYYVSQTIDGCESERTQVEIIVNEIPEAPAAEAQVFCGEAIVADLVPAPGSSGGESSGGVTEDFVTGMSTTMSGDIELSTGIWTFNTMISSEVIPGIDDDRGIQFQANGSSALSPSFNGVQSVTFYASSVSIPGTLQVLKVVDGSEILLEELTTSVGDFTSPDYVQYTVPVNDPGENIRIKFQRTSSGVIMMDKVIFNYLDGGSTINWYADVEGGLSLAIDTALQTGTYYVSQTVDGCESTRTPIEVTVGEAPAAPAAEAQSFCGEATVADLVPESLSSLNTVFEDNFDNLNNWTAVNVLGSTVWEISAFGNPANSAYINGFQVNNEDWLVSNPIAIPSTVNVATFNFDSASNYIGPDLEVYYTTNYTGDVSTTTWQSLSPVLSTSGYFVWLNSGPINVSDAIGHNLVIAFKYTSTVGTNGAKAWEIDNLKIVTEGSNIKWYETADATEPLAADTPLQTGTYYVSQILDGCESTRTAVEVTVSELPDAPVAEAQEFCGEAAVADLTAQGSDLRWYAAEDATEELAEITTLQTGTYYVSQTTNNCESERTAVEITVNEIPDAPAAEAQEFCGEAAVADLTAQGTDLKWYAAEDATEELAEITTLQTGTYYVSQTTNNCESERTAVEITINEIPDAPVAEAQEFCGEAAVADLTAQGSNLKWYAAADATEELTDTTTLQTGNYYVSQTVNDCKSERTEVTVTVNEIPALPVVESQAFCGEATAADLQGISADLQWYPTVDATESLASDTILQTGIYYVSQVVNDCESTKTGVLVTVNEIPEAPLAQDQDFCVATTATVAGLVAQGTDLKWYDTDDATEALADNTVLQAGTYYVSQTVNGCESERTEVAVTLNDLPEAPLAEAQTFCGETTIADLAAEGNNLKWYNTADATEELASGTVLQTGNYYVSQTINGCESNRTAVPVTVNVIPPAPIAQDQTFCGTTTIAYLSVTVVNGASAKWYESEDATEVLPGFTFIFDGMTYYVSQTLNGCEGPRTPVTVIINPIPFSPIASAQYFCGGGTVSELTAEGENLLWYLEEAEGEPLSQDTVLTSGTYYVSQTVNGCESTARTAVAVAIGGASEAPVAEAQSFCSGAAVADLVAQGSGIQWYDAPGALEALPANTTLQTGIYYASQTINDCESPKTAVEVTVNDLPEAPVTETEQEYEVGETLNDLVVEGENLSWYDDEGNQLPAGTVLTDGTYYVSQTINGCESETIAITVTETLDRNSFDDSTFSYYPNPVTDILYISYSENITSVSVFNLLGQQLKAVSGEGSDVKLDLSDFPAATYIVKVVAGDKEKIVKVVKR